MLLRPKVTPISPLPYAKIFCFQNYQLQETPIRSGINLKLTMLSVLCRQGLHIDIDNLFSVSEYFVGHKKTLL